MIQGARVETLGVRHMATGGREPRRNPSSATPTREALMRPARVGLVVAGVHLLVTMVGAIISVGAAFGASRPWAGSVGEHLVMGATAVLLAPLTILNAVLPKEYAPGWPVIGVILTSVAWGLAAYAIARWRESRRGVQR